MSLRLGRKTKADFRHRKGYVFSSETLLNTQVVVYNAVEAGFKKYKTKYIGFCENHGQSRPFFNIREAKDESNYPDFCTVCAKKLPDIPTFYKRMRVFMRRAQRLIDRHTEKGREPRQLDYRGGSKRIRVIFTDVSPRARPWIYIDRVTGNCLRARDESTAFPEARGNLFNHDYGVPKTPEGYPKSNGWASGARKRGPRS